MADKPATIRLRAIFDETASKPAFDQLNRRIAQQTVEAQKQTKILATSMDAEERASAQARLGSSLRLIRSALDMEKKERGNYRALNQRETQIEQERQYQDQMKAAEKLHTRIVWQQHQTEQAKQKLADRVLLEQYRADQIRLARADKTGDAVVKVHAKERESFLRNLSAVETAEDQHEAKVRQRTTRAQDEMGLRGFGGKMILGHAAGMAAGDIIGDRHGGQELGSVIGAFLFGGPEVAAGVAAIELVGAYFRAVREGAQEARRETAQYLDTLQGMADVWSGLISGPLQVTTFGGTMEKEMARASAAARKANSDMETNRILGRGFGETIAWVAHGVFTDPFNEHPETTPEPIEVRQQAAIRQFNLAIDARNRAFILENREASARAESQGRILAIERQSYAVMALRPGLLKEERSLTTQIAREDTVRAEEQAAQLRAGKEAMESLGQQRDLARAEDKEKGTPETRNALMDLTAQLQAAELRYLWLQNQHRAANVAAQAKHEAERIDFAVKRGLVLEKIEDQTQEAIIRSQTRGWGQRTALREAAFRQELRDAGNDLDLWVALTERHRAIRAADATEMRLQLQADLAHVSPANALGQLREQQQEWAAAGATPAQVEAMTRDALTSGYRRSAADLRTDLALRRGAIPGRTYGERARNADIEKMTAGDIRALMPGPEGDQVRAAIREEADARAAMRNLQPNPVGLGTGAFQAGYVDFKSLYPTQPKDPLTLMQEQVQLLKRVADLFEQRFRALN